MLWASGGGGGGYPGVVSTGPSALELDALVVRNSLGLSRRCDFFVTGPPGTTLVDVREGLHNDGMVLLNGVGVFNHTPPASPTTGGSHTAGGTYTAVEQAMLEACYTALQSIGLVT